VANSGPFDFSAVGAGTTPPFTLVAGTYSFFVAGSGSVLLEQADATGNWYNVAIAGVVINLYAQQAKNVLLGQGTYRLRVSTSNPGAVGSMPTVGGVNIHIC
jgi:hypothetical protein